ncbi:hypothetical protein ApAK_06855 [Thermoplasmatales archaeon AK]|nr:hypothetical protein [Thermoplasmatales archaeon AK]
MGDVRVLAVQAPRMPAYDALKYFRKITESAASRDVDFVRWFSLFGSHE